MKKVLCLVCSLLILCSLASCGGKKSYGEVPVERLMTDAQAVLKDAPKFSVADSYYLGDYFEMPSNVDSYRLEFATSQNCLDEIGIFHVGDGKTAELKKLLSEYLETYYDDNLSFFNSYMPEETVKLRDAEVRVFGNYVVYTILGKEDRKAVFERVETALTADN